MKKLLYALLSILVIILACSKEEQTPDPLPIPNYTLNFSADTGGTVSTEGGTYNQGSKITVTATPDGQFLFKEWSDGSTQNPREITVTSNLTLKASFIKKTYPLSVNIDGEGTVQEQVIIQGSTTETEYNAGTTVRLTATPNEGWEFSMWVVDGVVITENPIEVAIEKGREATVFFKRKFDLNIVIQGQGQVNKEDIDSNKFRLTATPSEGWNFLRWTGNFPQGGSSDNPITIEYSNNDIEVTAIFESTPVKINLEVNGGGFLKITQKDSTIFYSNNSFGSVGPINRIGRKVLSSFNLNKNEEFLIEAISDDLWELGSWESSLEIEGFPKTVKVLEDSISLKLDFKMKLPQGYIVNEFEFYPSYPITWTNLGPTFSDPCGKFYLSDENGEYFLFGGTTPFKSDPTPSILFKKVNGEWIIHKIYEEASMGQPRNFKVLPNNEFVLSDSGEHGDQPWLGNLWFGKLVNDGIEWKKVNKSNEKGFFHGVTIGDLNNDGLSDFGGVPTTSADGIEWFTYGIFVQNQDGSFERRNELWNPEFDSLSVSDIPFTINFADVMGDERDEIITANYGSGWLPDKSDRNRIDVYEFDDSLGRYKLKFRSANPDIHPAGMGATSIRIADFNNDGFMDISVAREGGNSQA
ncbi:MAG: hypothetical protein RLZZ242_135, partial [Bacteroidota bacterium]